MRSFAFIALLLAAVAGGAGLIVLQSRAPAPEQTAEVAPEPPETPVEPDPAPEPEALIDLSPQTEEEREPYREAPYPAQLVIPVSGVAAADLLQDWGDPRSGGRSHQGLDIAAGIGTPVLAADSGEIRKFFDSQAGGTTIYQADSSGRYILYYAHLDARARGLEEGQRVRAGQIIGYVGTSGNAPPGAPHLHFEVNLAPENGAWSGGEAVDPYPLLLGSEAVRAD